MMPAQIATKLIVTRAAPRGAERPGVSPRQKGSDMRLAALMKAARIYSATAGKSRYSVTVVDFNQAQRILTEKAKSCPAGAEPCLGGPGDEGHWMSDIRGAIDWATWQIMKRDAKVTLFVWAAMDLVEGRQLQL